MNDSSLARLTDAELHAFFDTLFPGGFAGADVRADIVPEGWAHMRFYMGTIWIAGRADLTPVYAMIFRRLQAMRADWICHFPQIGMLELAPSGEVAEPPAAPHSASEGAIAQLDAGPHRAGVRRLRAELDAINGRAREDAMEEPPPATVRAYRQVYGRDPRGWPPA